MKNIEIELTDGWGIISKLDLPSKEEVLEKLTTLVKYKANSILAYSWSGMFLADDFRYNYRMAADKAGIGAIFKCDTPYVISDDPGFYKGFNTYFFEISVICAYLKLDQDKIAKLITETFEKEYKSK